MADKGKRVEVVGYMRTSSATNVGDGKDSEARQRKAIEGYAEASGAVIVDWFYDAAVSGADPIEVRPGFAELLARIADNGVARSSSRRQTASPAISWSRKSATQCCGAWA